MSYASPLRWSPGAGMMLSMQITSASYVKAFSEWTEPDLSRGAQPFYCSNWPWPEIYGLFLLTIQESAIATYRPSYGSMSSAGILITTATYSITSEQLSYRFLSYIPPWQIRLKSRFPRRLSHWHEIYPTFLISSCLLIVVRCYCFHYALIPRTFFLPTIESWRFKYAYDFPGRLKHHILDLPFLFPAQFPLLPLSVCLWMDVYMCHFSFFLAGLRFGLFYWLHGNFLSIVGARFSYLRLLFLTNLSTARALESTAQYSTEQCIHLQLWQGSSTNSVYCILTFSYQHRIISTLR